MINTRDINSLVDFIDLNNSKLDIDIYSEDEKKFREFCNYHRLDISQVQILNDTDFGICWIKGFEWTYNKINRNDKEYLMKQLINCFNLSNISGNSVRIALSKSIFI